MLVLSRQELQRIKIGADVVITVVRIKGDQVRIGIEAPPSVPIVRQELDERDPPGNGGCHADAA